MPSFFVLISLNNKPITKLAANCVELFVKTYSTSAPKMTEKSRVIVVVLERLCVAVKGETACRVAYHSIIIKFVVIACLLIS